MVDSWSEEHTVRSASPAVLLHLDAIGMRRIVQPDGLLDCGHVVNRRILRVGRFTLCEHCRALTA